MKQTAKYILKSFQSSNKRHLIITGSKQSGKTTIFVELAGLLADKNEFLPGITTQCLHYERVVICENNTDNKAIAANFNGGKMCVNENAFNCFGASALERALKSGCEWVGIDELGYLESECEAFIKAVYDTFEQKRVIAVVRKQNTVFLNSLISRRDAFVFDLDEHKMKTGCVIMASGESKRFGRNKLIEPFNGKPMIQHALDTVDGLFEKTVVVTRNAEVSLFCERWGTEVIFHKLPNRNDTVRLGVEALGNMDRIMFLPADQPMLKKETLKSMLHSFRLQDDLILRLSYDKQPGTPILFGKKYFDELKALPERKGGAYLAQKYHEKVLLFNAGSSLELYDIDTQRDLEYLAESIDK